MTVLSFNLPIWRVFYDEAPTASTQDLLVLELRNQQQVAWCAIDTVQEKVLWQKTFDEIDWWTSAVRFEAGILRLHHYDNPEQLVPKKKSQIDIITAQHSFNTTQSNESAALNTRWQSSTAHTPASPYYQILCSFVEKNTGQKPISTINYGEMFGNILAIHYFYHSNAFTLSRSILVVHSSKTTLLHQTIEDDAEADVLDVCIYNEKCIVCLKKQYELVVLKWLKP